MIDREKFATLFLALAYSKIFEIKTENIIKVYYEDLKDLEFIEITLKNARKRQYLRNMPTVAELIEDHRQVKKANVKIEHELLEGEKISPDKWRLLREQIKGFINRINFFI